MLSSEQRGSLKSWNDAKGFGFIQPEQGGEQLFVHISALRGERRPQPGEVVLYVAGRDAQGRLRAEHMRHEGLSLDRPAIRRKPNAANPVPTPRGKQRESRQKSGGIRQLSLKLAVLGLLCSLPAVGAWQLWRSDGAVWAMGIYPLLSLLSFAQYWHDKSSAQAGRWRTPESHLQIVALLGGWPGALIAQQVFRHKTRKLAFLLPFWLIVLLHQGFWFDWLLFDGRLFAEHLLRWLPTLLR